MKGRIHRALGTAAAGLAACALLAGGVQAADRPDDQAGAIGVGGVSLNVPSDVVDRAIARHLAASALSDVVERAIARRSAAALRDRGTGLDLRMAGGALEVGAGFGADAHAIGQVCPRDRADELAEVRRWLARNPVALVAAGPDAAPSEPVAGGATIHQLQRAFRASDRTRNIDRPR